MSKTRTIIDPEKLEITNDPVVSRYSGPGKYDDIFRRLTIGQCIKCEPQWADKLGQALRTYLAKNNRPGRVKTSRNYEKDGKGRVWLLPVVRK